MTASRESFPFLPLFVPGDRPDRFAKAAASGADAVLVDLEDAVAPRSKAKARDGLKEGLAALPDVRCPIFVRVNAAATEWHAADVEAVLELPADGIVLPKAEDPGLAAALAERLGPGRSLIALIESPRGLANARPLAETSARLAFGSIDFAVSFGAAHVREALAAARSELVLASALAGLPGPIDGVTTAIDDAAAIAEDARYAAMMGFAGKLLIHPRQIGPAIDGFSPSEDEIARARTIVEAVEASGAGEGAAIAVGGAMVDAPVIAWARGVMARAERRKEVGRKNIMSGETKTLATFVAGLTNEAIPSEVRQRARELALDFAGSIVRAGAESESTPSLIATIDELGLGGPGAAGIVGQKRRLAPPVAALVNGMLGHSLDFDDTHADSSLHPSAPVVPAALAVGEMLGSSGADVVTAIVAGYEVCCRLGNALDPASHYARGFHPTATAGTFGAAAAAAKLFGLDAGGIATAFGVAGSQASGSLQFLVNGAWNKRSQVGEAAMKGVLAATFAKNGFKGSAEPIEGRHGLLVGYTDDPHPEKAVAGLGEIWETMRIGMKPYPACRYTHAALDGLIRLRGEGGWSGADVRHVTVGLHRNGITLTGDPIAAKRRVRSIVDGQFSMPFVGAVALDQGSFGWDDFKRIGDPVLDELSDRIDVVRDESLEGLPHPFGATLKVETAAGTKELRVPDPSGEPATFPDAAAIRAKFLGLAEPVLGAEAEDLAGFFEGLDAAEDVLHRPGPSARAEAAE